MHKIILVCLFTMLSASFSFGQSANDTIIIKKSLGSYKFYQNEHQLSMSKMVEMMKVNEEAYTKIKAAQTTKTWDLILSSAGGFLIGFPIGTAIGGGDPNWAMAGVGAGLVLISIPIHQKFLKQSKEAVDTYNASMLANTSQKKTAIYFTSTAHGLGMALKF